MSLGLTLSYIHRDGEFADAFQEGVVYFKGVELAYLINSFPQEDGNNIGLIPNSNHLVRLYHAIHCFSSTVWVYSKAATSNQLSRIIPQWPLALDPLCIIYFWSHKLWQLAA